MRRILFSVLSVGLLAACSDGMGPGSQVSLSFAGGTVAAAPDLAFAAGPITDGANTLELSSVEVVLREIELKRQEVTDCDVSPKPPGCEEFEVGPVLVPVPLDGNPATEVTIDIEPGTYTEIEFDVHKISSGDEEDAEFRLLHPEFVETSIRVQGTFNGVPFTYTTDLDVEQEHNLVPALEIGETTASTNVTVYFGLSQWFRDAQGNLVDPATGNKGGENESLIKENIKQAIDAFEDKDRDGVED